MDRTLEGMYRGVNFARSVCNCLERAGSVCQARLAKSKADVPAYTAASWPEVGGGSRWESYACAMCVFIGEEKNLMADKFLRSLHRTHSTQSKEATRVILCHKFQKKAIATELRCLEGTEACYLWISDQKPRIHFFLSHKEKLSNPSISCFCFVFLIILIFFYSRI